MLYLCAIPEKIGGRGRGALPKSTPGKMSAMESRFCKVMG